MDSTKLEQLLRDIFDERMRAGKPLRITIAVLKNRLLDKTNRTFNESQYGASSIADLIKKFPHLISLDLSQNPPIVEWKSETVVPTVAIDEGKRVRNDLWRAVMYLHDKECEWNEETKSISQASPDSQNKIPKVDRDKLIAWRKAFSDLQRPSIHDAHELQRLDKWSTDLKSVTPNLPKQLQRPWNDYVKKQVAAHIASWFSQNKYDPSSIWTTDDIGSRPGHVNDLRAFIHRCIDAMTESELNDLRLAPGVLLRTTNRKHGV